MKISVTAQGDTLDSPVAPRFGRCQFFVIVDAETLQFEAIKNPNIDAAGGAGIQAGQVMAEKQVKAVLTGHVGPNAFQTLNVAGISVMTGATGTVREAVERFKNGEFIAAQGPTSGAMMTHGK